MGISCGKGYYCDWMVNTPINAKWATRPYAEIQDEMVRQQFYEQIGLDIDEGHCQVCTGNTSQPYDYAYWRESCTSLSKMDRTEGIDTNSSFESNQSTEKITFSNSTSSNSKADFYMILACFIVFFIQ
jgi:hypothetical protein